MLERRFAIVSGATSRFANHLANALKGIGVVTCFVKYTQGISTEYFERLAARSCDVLLRYPTDQTFAFVTIISFFEAESDITIETNALFPIATRIQCPAHWKNDLQKTQSVVELLSSFFLDEKIASLHRKRRQLKDKRQLLPIENCKVPRLKKDITDIYFGRSDKLSGNISKYVIGLRGKSAFRAGRLNFQFAVNSPQHPIRRCTKSSLCDLRALLRLGTNVPPSTEFDVTSEGRLNDTSFILCSGEVRPPPKSCDHLNMRINDDWKPARK